MPNYQTAVNCRTGFFQISVFGTATINSVHERCIFNNMYFCVRYARHVSASAGTPGYFEQAKLCHVWAVLLCHNTAADCRDRNRQFGFPEMTSRDSCRPAFIADRILFFFCLENYVHQMFPLWLVHQHFMSIQLPMNGKECGKTAATSSAPGLHSAELFQRLKAETDAPQKFY